MSLIHADNFNVYGNSTAPMLNGRYTQVNNCSIVTDPDGISTAKVLYTEAGFFRRAIKTPTSKIGVGCRIWLSSLPANNQQTVKPVSWRDASNQLMVEYEITTTGSIKAYVFDDVNDTVYTIGDTVAPVVGANAWWQLEALFDASAKTLEIRVEGDPVLICDASDFNGHQNSGPTIYQMSYGLSADGIGGHISGYLKDYFQWDGLGSLNNDFLGSCLVTDLAPASDITLGGWVPSTGSTGWNILNQFTPPVSTPNVAAGYPVPLPMSVTMTNLPANVTSVKGMVTLVRAAKTDGGDGNLQVSTISGAATGAGTDRPITVAQTYWEDVSEIDPNTSDPWTPVSVNNMGLKVDRTL